MLVIVMPVLAGILAVCYDKLAYREVRFTIKLRRLEMPITPADGTTFAKQSSVAYWIAENRFISGRDRLEAVLYVPAEATLGEVNCAIVFLEGRHELMRRRGIAVYQLSNGTVYGFRSTPTPVELEAFERDCIAGQDMACDFLQWLNGAVDWDPVVEFTVCNVPVSEKQDPTTKLKPPEAGRAPRGPRP